MTSEFARVNECINATPQKGKILWFSGRSNAGKSELATRVSSRCKDFIALDGDELFNAIGADLHTDKLSLRRFDLRIARLAKILTYRNHNVAIANICGYPDVRDEINLMMKVEWIYVRRDELQKKHTTFYNPYFPPENPALILDMSNSKLLFEDAFKILIEKFKLKLKEKI